MERIAWKGCIKDGKKAEYIKRHEDIGAEMTRALKEAGICNYTIFAAGEELFGYYECEKGAKFAEDCQANSPVVDQWNKFMEDVLEPLIDPVTGAQTKMCEVFRLE